MNKNTEREVILVSSPETLTTAGTRKREKYGDYTRKVRTKIAPYAIEHRKTSAARRFSKKLETNLNESTVRGMKSAYEKIKKFNEKLQVTTHITSLPKFSGGRP